MAARSASRPEPGRKFLDQQLLHHQSHDLPACVELVRPHVCCIVVNVNDDIRVPACTLLWDAFVGDVEDVSGCLTVSHVVWQVSDVSMGDGLAFLDVSVGPPGVELSEEPHWHFSSSGAIWLESDVHQQHERQLLYLQQGPLQYPVTDTRLQNLSW